MGRGKGKACVSFVDATKYIRIARTRDVSSKINNMYQVIVPPIIISKAIYYKRVGFVSLIRLANFLHENPSQI